jgi:outer membrane protein assembly factor BamB
VDATSGEILYRKRLGGGEYLASLVAGDGKIYVPNKDGEIHVVKAGRDFQRLATNSIGEPSFSSPALVENRIFLRGKEHLFCIFTETARSEDGPSDAERVSTSD